MLRFLVRCAVLESRCAVLESRCQCETCNDLVKWNTTRAMLGKLGLAFEVERLYLMETCKQCNEIKRVAHFLSTIVT